MPQSAKICIYFGDTGGGHRSAAEAVRAGIEAAAAKTPNHPVCVLTMPVVERSHPVNQHVVSFYNYLARHHTTWIKYLYHLLHFVRLESGHYYRLYRLYLKDLLLEQKPSVIVTVHPMIAEAMALARDEFLDPSVKLVVVVTDPNERLWRAWACQKADLIVAPNQAVGRKLVDWGIDPGKIQVLGMPIHPDFLSPPRVPRAKFLSALGLSPNLLTVCINSGWAGNAHLLNAYRALVKCRRQLQVIILTGHNQTLQQSAAAMAGETGIPTVVLPFHHQMSDLMSAVDVMVTKAGGLTTYQALARRLPMILDNTIEPMPQEEPTMRNLVSLGLATRLDSPADLPKMIDSFAPQSMIKSLTLPALHELNMTDNAIFKIAASILALSSAAEDEQQPSIQEVA